MPQLVVTLAGDWGLILIEILLVEILLKQAPCRYSLKLPETATVGYGVGQGWVLQSWLLSPLQAAPHSFGGGLVQVLVCVPPLHDTEQALHALHPPSTGVQHDWVLQSRVSVVPQSFVLLCVPPPQETLQALHALQLFSSHPESAQGIYVQLGIPQIMSHLCLGLYPHI